MGASNSSDSAPVPASGSGGNVLGDSSGGGGSGSDGSDGSGGSKGSCCGGKSGGHDSPDTLENKKSIGAARIFWNATQSASVGATAEERLRQEQLLCLRINGFRDDQFGELHCWGRPDSKMMKPQYLHSAMGVHIMLLYPQMRGPGNFVNNILDAKMEAEYLACADRVLRADPDGAVALAQTDAQMTGRAGAPALIVRDDRNGTITVVSKDRASATRIGPDTPVVAFDVATMRPI